MNKVLIFIAVFLFSSMSFSSPLDACPAVALQSKADVKSTKGQWTYVDFWASWCGPCRETFPFMNQLQEKYKGKLNIVAISVDDNKKDALDFLKKFPAKFPTYLDTTGVCPTVFKVKGMPSSYLISPAGKVVFSEAGFKASSAKHIMQVIDKAMKQ